MRRDFEMVIEQDLNRFRVYYMADKVRAIGARREAQDDEALAYIYNAGAIAVARQITVQKFGRYRTGAAGAVANQIMDARDQPTFDNRRLLLREVFDGGAEQTIPMALNFKNLRKFMLTIAADKNRRLQHPLIAIWRGSQADAIACVRFRDAVGSGGKIHQPAGALRVFHHSWVAHLMVMPFAMMVGFVMVSIWSGKIKSKASIALPRPCLQIGRNRVTNPLKQPLFGLAGPCVVKVPVPVVTFDGWCRHGHTICPKQNGL